MFVTSENRFYDGGRKIEDPSILEWLDESPSSIEGEEKTVGQILKEARQNKGLTTGKVLYETGVSEEYLLKLEADELKTPSTGVLWKLTKFYQLDMKYILTKAGVIIKKPESTFPTPIEQKPAFPINVSDEVFKEASASAYLSPEVCHDKKTSDAYIQGFCTAHARFCGSMEQNKSPFATHIENERALSQPQDQEVPEEIQKWIDGYIDKRLKAIVANSASVEWIAKRICQSIREGAEVMYHKSQEIVQLYVDVADDQQKCIDKLRKQLEEQTSLKNHCLQTMEDQRKTRENLEAELTGANQALKNAIDQNCELVAERERYGVAWDKREKVLQEVVQQRDELTAKVKELQEWHDSHC